MLFQVALLGFCRRIVLMFWRGKARTTTYYFRRSVLIFWRDNSTKREGTNRQQKNHLPWCHAVIICDLCFLHSSRCKQNCCMISVRSCLLCFFLSRTDLKWLETRKARQQSNFTEDLKKSAQWLLCRWFICSLFITRWIIALVSVKTGFATSLFAWKVCPWPGT